MINLLKKEATVFGSVLIIDLNVNLVLKHGLLRRRRTENMYHKLITLFVFVYTYIPSINLLMPSKLEIIDSDIRIQSDEMVISPSKLITRIFPDTLSQAL